MLTFRSAAHESAFAGEYNYQRLQLDPRNLRISMALNTVVRCERV